MDKLVRKIEVPLAKKAIEKAGLYIVQEKDLDRLAEVAADAYKDYPLHNWFTNGKYDAKASKLIMQISLRTMTEELLSMPIVKKSTVLQHGFLLVLQAAKHFRSSLTVA